MEDIYHVCLVSSIYQAGKQLWSHNYHARNMTVSIVGLSPVCLATVFMLEICGRAATELNRCLMIYI